MFLIRLGRWALLPAVLLTLAGNAIGQSPRTIIFDDYESLVYLKLDRAVFFNEQFKPIFISDGDYAASYLFLSPRKVSEPKRIGEVSEWDLQRRMLRFQGRGRSLWVRCSDVSPKLMACSNLRIKSDGEGRIHVFHDVEALRVNGVGAKGLMQLQPGISRDAEPKEDVGVAFGISDSALQGVPTCPGDPRCP